MERQDIAVKALRGHAARVAALREIDGGKVEVVEPAEREDGRAVGEVAAAVADAVAEHGNLPAVGGIRAEGAHARPLPHGIALAVKRAHAPVKGRGPVMGLRVVDLGHVARERLDWHGIGVVLGIHRVDGDFVARGRGLADPCVDGVKKRLPSPAAVLCRQHGRIHRRQVRRGVEHGKVAVRRVGRAVEVEGSHAPVDGLGPRAKLVCRKFAQWRVVGVLVDAARAEDGFIGVLGGRQMPGFLGKEFDLVHDGLVVRVPGQDGRIRERRLGRRHTEARRRRCQEMRGRLMARRQEERREHDDKARKAEDGREEMAAAMVMEILHESSPFLVVTVASQIAL